MRLFLILGSLTALTGCAAMQAGPPVPNTPATPVFFQPFSVALDPPALATVAQAARLANEEPGTRVIVIGAADPAGSLQENILLSKTRAQVVADQLAADGVDAGRIRTHGIGETDTPAGAAQEARRALIVIKD